MYTITKDPHGVYIQVNGSYYRPEKSVNKSWRDKCIFVSDFNEGDQVDADNTAVVTCVVRNQDITERWKLHDFVCKNKHSAYCWYPYD